MRRPNCTAQQACPIPECVGVCVVCVGEGGGLDSSTAITNTGVEWPTHEHTLPSLQDTPNMATRKQQPVLTPPIPVLAGPETIDTNERPAPTLVRERVLHTRLELGVRSVHDDGVL
jgi:hypothetical protein